MNNIDEIDQLKSKLLSAPDVNLLSFHRFPPVSKDVLVSVERSLNLQLPQDIIDLYLKTNGLQVRWDFSTNEVNYLKEINISGSPFPSLWPAEHYWQLDGVINILPLEEVLFKDYKDFMWFDFETDYTIDWKGSRIPLDQFKKQLKPIDVFDKYYTVAIYLADVEMPLLLGEDHNADFLSYPTSNFKSYINFLFDSLGEVDKRKDFFINIDTKQ